MANFQLDFTPTKDASGVVNWTMCINGKDCSPAPNQFATVPVPHGQADAKFTMNIVNDNTGMGIKFAPTDALWVQQGAKPSGPGIDSQIYDVTVNSKGTTLKFTDANCNHNAIDLSYRLNFVDSGGKAVNKPVDPDIHNGGSALVSPDWTDFAAYTPAQWTELAIAFVVGFAIAAVIFRRSRPAG
jgi:hypothetical protein